MGQTECDHINRMITIIGDFYLMSFIKWDFENALQYMGVLRVFRNIYFVMILSQKALPFYIHL